MIKSFAFTTLLFISFGTFAQIDDSAVANFAKSFSEKNNVPIEEVNAILNKATYQADIIEKMSKPAEGTMTWERYRKIFIILGIIGVETYFGRIKGSYKVLDALYTLSFGYPKRSKFFTSELEAYLILAKEEKLDIETTKGSYAGAMGYSQFMPTSYRAYAKSFEDNGTRDCHYFRSQLSESPSLGER